MDINIPEVLEEVTRAFERYESALGSNDIATLNELFWANSLTIRYGIGEELYGHDAIAAYRNRRDPADLARTLTRIVITTFGRDFATANCEYRRVRSGQRGRQSQSWVRTPAGWRIVSAHVSMSTAS
jgi:hypothetical protein